ncbi:YhbY family RNA-binding protein [Thermoproteota archaeon]
MIISADLKKGLKAKAKLMDPVVRIGKNGVTDSILVHTKALLKKRKLIKVKMLKSFADTHDKKLTANKLAEDAGAVLIELVGSTIVLYRYKTSRNDQEK